MLALTVRLQRLVAAERGLRELSEHQSAENARLVESLARAPAAARAALEDPALDRQPPRPRRGLRRDRRRRPGAARRRDRRPAADRSRGPADADDGGLAPGSSRSSSSELRRSPLGLGAGGRAAAEGRLVVVEDYAADDAGTCPAFAADGIRAALAAPVHEHGRGRRQPRGRHPPRRAARYSQAEREMLLAFAEHASLALNDAKTVEDAIHQALPRLAHRAARTARC